LSCFGHHPFAVDHQAEVEPTFPPIVRLPTTTCPRGLGAGQSLATPIRPSGRAPELILAPGGSPRAVRGARPRRWDCMTHQRVSEAGPLSNPHSSVRNYAGRRNTGFRVTVATVAPLPVTRRAGGTNQTTRRNRDTNTSVIAWGPGSLLGVAGARVFANDPQQKARRRRVEARTPSKIIRGHPPDGPASVVPACPGPTTHPAAVRVDPSLAPPTTVTPGKRISGLRQPSWPAPRTTPFRIDRPATRDLATPRHQIASAVAVPPAFWRTPIPRPVRHNATAAFFPGTPAFKVADWWFPVGPNASGSLRSNRGFRTHDRTVFSASPAPVPAEHPGHRIVPCWTDLWFGAPGFPCGPTRTQSVERATDVTQASDVSTWVTPSSFPER